MVAPETESHAGGETGAGRLVGTPGYMSPEQATGRPIDQRTDLFSLGVCIYEMVTGARPFINTSTVAVLVATTCDTPEPPSKRNPLVLPSLERIIHRCLTKRVEDRYTTAAEVLRDLDQLDVPDAAAGVRTLASSPRAIVAAREGAGKSARKRGRPLLWGTLAMVATFGVVFGALQVIGTSPSPVPTPGSAVAEGPPASATPAKTALPDLPAPVSQMPAALVAYRAALLAFHDGNFEAFDHGMRESVRLDPAFAAGYLRVAFAKFHSVRGAVTDARSDLERAFRLRDQLSPRDQKVLDLLEPVINREPPDSAELERRLASALAAYPLDAELLYLLANEQRRYDVDASLATYERVLDIDPGFMTALRQKAQTLEMRGDVDGARRALDDCLRQVPGATGCRNERIWLNQNEGRCDLIEADARQMIAADPESFRAYDALARAEVSLGRPRAAVDEIFGQAWRRAPSEVRAREEALVTANLAVLAGEFEKASALAKVYESAIAADTAAQVHASAARLRAEIAVEVGDPRGAAKVAQEFLARQIAWSGGPDGDTARLLFDRARGRYAGPSVVPDGARGVPRRLDEAIVTDALRERRRLGARVRGAGRHERERRRGAPRARGARAGAGGLSHGRERRGRRARLLLRRQRGARGAGPHPGVADVHRRDRAFSPRARAPPAGRCSRGQGRRRGRVRRLRRGAGALGWGEAAVDDRRKGARARATAGLQRVTAIAPRGADV